MPTSRNGARAPSMTFMKTQGDRESPKGETLYCYARPSNVNLRNGLCHKKDQNMNVSILQVDRCKPILGLDAFDNAPMRHHLQREPV